MGLNILNQYLDLDNNKYEVLFLLLIFECASKDIMNFGELAVSVMHIYQAQLLLKHIVYYALNLPFR